MRKITFTNKVENQGATYTGKAWAADFNEIKEIVNENADITTITMAVTAEYIDGILYFKNYLGQIIYQVSVSGLVDTLNLGDLNDVVFENLDDDHAPLYDKVLGYFKNKKVSLFGHTHDDLYSPLGHNHDSLYAPISHSGITSGNPHGVSYDNILGTKPFYTKSESDLKYHPLGGSLTEDFLAQTMYAKKTISETLVIPTTAPVLSPGEWALYMSSNGLGGEPPTGGTVSYLNDLVDVSIIEPIGGYNVLGRSNNEWSNITLTTAHISNLDTLLGNRYTKSESDARYPILSYGIIPASYLPSYVDDIIEVATFSALPVIGETGKIYVTLDTNLTYRWSGTAYTEISKSLALGETSETAYRGDRGKTAYDHSQIISGNPHGVSYSNITGTVPFYTKSESDLRYHPLYGSNLIDFTAKKLKSETLIIPTNLSPELSAGEWALVMTSNGFSGEPPAGGVVGYLNDLNDVTISSPLNNQFLMYDGSKWINNFILNSQIISALGYTPYNSTNPSGYISAITGTMVQAVLTGEITSHFHDNRYYTEAEINNFFSGVTAITGYNKSNWDTAYGWGNHASAGYALASNLTSHINNTSNPHSVTFTQLGGKPTTLSGYGISSTDTLFDNKYLGINANAVSATKLYNVRTIWGQSFDGTANVSGAITGATDITASARLKSGTLLIPTTTPSLLAGEWGLVMTNNGFSGEAPEGGIVGTLNDLSDVTISSPLVNHFLTFNGSQWINSYLSSSQITTALGYTPYNSSNPSGYISGITGSMVNTALGYTAQEQLNGTGLVRMSGTGVSYDNNSYALVSSLNNYWNKSGNWISASLTALGATRVMGVTGESGASEFALATLGGQMYPYADGFFYQNEGQYRVLDTSNIGTTVAAYSHNHNGTYALLAGSSSQDFSVKNLYLSKVAGATSYIIVDEGSFTGKVVMQAGYGSAAAGGAINLYGAGHLTNAGDVVIGLSGQAGAKFRVNTEGLDGGTDLLTILRTGAATFASSVSATSFISGGNAVLHAGNYSSYALPLSGGVLTTSGVSPLAVNSTHATANEIDIYFRLSGVNKGAIGFYGGWASPSMYMQDLVNGHTLRISQDGNARVNENIVIHSGNYTSYAATASHNHNGTYALILGAITQDFQVKALTMNGALTGATTGLFSSTVEVARLNVVNGNKSIFMYNDGTVQKIVAYDYGVQGQLPIVIGDDGAVVNIKGTVSATTAKLTNLTDGYIPYHISDASGLGNSIISQSGTTINIGGILNSIGGKVYLSRNLTSLETRRNWGLMTELFKVGDFCVLESETNITDPSVVRFQIQSGGNVGIGYTNRSEKFAVDGSGYFNGSVDIEGAVYTTGIRLPYNVVSSIWGQSNGGIIQILSDGTTANRWVRMGISTYDGIWGGGVTVRNDLSVYSDGYIETASYLKATSIKIGDNWEAIPNGSAELELRQGGGVALSKVITNSIKVNSLELNGHVLTIE